MITASRPGSAAAASLALDNGGVAVTIDQPPERVVAIKSTAVETLLALGLEDRIVGRAFEDGPVSAPWQAAAAAVPSSRTSCIVGSRALRPSRTSSTAVGEQLRRRRGRHPRRARRARHRHLRRPGGLQDGALQARPPPSTTSSPRFPRSAASSASSCGRRRWSQNSAMLATLPKPERRRTALWYSSGVKEPCRGGDGGLQMMMTASASTTSSPASTTPGPR
jgi:iron complex transport system substrate-binding protein